MFEERRKCEWLKNFRKGMVIIKVEMNNLNCIWGVIKREKYER